MKVWYFRNWMVALLGLSLTNLVWAEMTKTPFDFPEVTREAKPWTRWWWLGSAVDDENLTRSLEEFAEVGLGGVEITPIYGVQGQADRNIDYLTPEWLARLAHTTSEAERLGLGVDMPTGTGWPFGGPRVTLEDADMKVTIESIPIKQTGDSIELPEDAVLLSLVAYLPNGTILDQTTAVDEGHFTGTAIEDATWYRVYYRFSGRKVKRPAPGGAGFSVNTYSEAALGNYLDNFESAMEGYSGRPLRAYFHDSFEYSGDWTPNLWDAFLSQHGYDLRHHLPEMTGHGNPDQIARIKSDYRETLAELLHHAFTAQWTNWAHKHGALTRNQAHGSPGNLLDLYATVDIPETEIFGPSGFPIPGLRKDPEFENEPPDLLMLKFASSAAHVTGKRLVSSETCTWLGEHFQVALSQMKPEVDQLFAAGINHIFYHGTPYSPTDAAWPGWLFYASVHFGPTNPWWDDFMYLNEYVGRCQALLQASLPANDVLLYFPLHDVWHDAAGLRKQLTVHNIDEWLVDTPFYDAARDLTQGGYAFDYISDAQLATATVEDRRVILPGGRYRAIVIPETPRMPPETLETLFKLADSGANIAFLGEVPQDVPGFGNRDQGTKEIQRLHRDWTAGLPATVERTIIPVGSGTVAEGQPLGHALDSAGVRPEVLATSGLSMLRRGYDGGHLYFIANLTATAVDDFWPLSEKAASVIWLDPLAARSGLATFRDAGETTAVRIALEPGESCFIRTLTDQIVTGEAWTYGKARGPAIPLTGTWRVAFTKGEPKLPKGFTTDTLGSWTASPDPEATRFAGTARYEIEFDAPFAGDQSWMLDLGTVCDSARVTLNDEFVGCAWSLPFHVRVGNRLKPAGNHLVIEVSNLAANLIADMDRRQVPWKIFEDTNVVNIKYKPFDASEWPTMASGLLGPVQWVPVE